MTPIVVNIPEYYKVTGIFAGIYHGCIQTEEGAVLCWGDNSYGQLGDGTQTSSYDPVVSATFAGTFLPSPAPSPVPSPVPTTANVTVAYGMNVGDRMTCVLNQYSFLTCSGWGYWGRLGDGTSADVARVVGVRVHAGRVATFDSFKTGGIVATDVGSVFYWPSSTSGYGVAQATEKLSRSYIVDVSVGGYSTTTSYQHFCAVAANASAVSTAAIGGGVRGGHV